MSPELNVAVGDWVIDTETFPDERTEAIVVEIPGQLAEECYIGALDATVAEVNPAYPATDPVVTVAFLDDLDTWAPGWESIPTDALADELAVNDEVTLYTLPVGRVKPLADR